MSQFVIVINNAFHSRSEKLSQLNLAQTFRYVRFGENLSEYYSLNKIKKQEFSGI
ncbi:26909_t:CDS:2 [Gigaspora margarita]|uniref:26909_t:CDS:1 n=1 Tax=Gigaspora margarita TaxID=4874 RepID=A0ABN7TYP8_GIGMA|nr:26909_t:CDS:2 [Gigaspora margarita]